ncbi:MAG: helix-turn-helix domain-containing protein [Planctomycetota bacterium]
MSRNANNDLIRVGLNIKEIRTRRGLTIAEVSARAGLSKGLLSKIENFRTIPSLPVLAAISKSLETDMGEIVKGVGPVSDDAKYILTKANKREIVSRDDAVGFVYESLGSRVSGSRIIDSFIITLSPESKRRTVTTDGDQFIYLLKGEIDFQFGRETIKMSKGDSLFFDGKVPHLPKCRKGKEAKLLAVYFLGLVQE